MVASEESRLGPDFQRLASLSRCGGKALYFPAGHGVAGHPGTCSLHCKRQALEPGENWSTPDTDEIVKGDRENSEMRRCEAVWRDSEEGGEREGSGADTIFL